MRQEPLTSEVEVSPPPYKMTPGEEAISLAAIRAWIFSDGGEVEKALEAYEELDRILIPYDSWFHPELSVLRHNPGEASGLVKPIPATEDRVVALIHGDTSIESPDNWGMKRTVTDGKKLERNIGDFIWDYKPKSPILENIKKDLPHVQVLSTGRCGTMSLYHLFGRTQLVPYHTFWWLLAPSTRWEMMCQLIEGETYPKVANFWASCRAAEWLGAISQDRPMIGLNHLDTIFAPTFAAIHPRSKFVHLRRDPRAVFNSFVSKNQWQGGQLSVMDYAFSPEFRWRGTEDGVLYCVVWYLDFTETFARAMGRVVGPERYIEISSDRLFAQDEDEIRSLIDFTEADISVDAAVEHFSKKFNAKDHRVKIGEPDMVEMRAQFDALSPTERNE